MTSERGRQVLALYAAASEKEPGRRRAFLDEACHGDQELRHEVESMLTSEQDAGSFLERPAWYAAAISSQSLLAGTQLGPYRILGPIGKGGMGEVYRARDTKLDRDVAIKILPALFAQDPERLARFEREAKVLASLNHPNIATIHGVEESGGVRALVMELVPGESLKGPLPVETTLDYARQIADALEAAHDKGVVHRDLKPANIMITPAGVVKVLDFGLAAVPQSSDPSDPGNSPTLTVSPTRAGMILGTAGYMSPEQAAGRPVDRRADIWSFGVVLFEVFTGKRLFDGETIAETLAQVLTKEPDWEQVPAKLRRLLEACLQRNPKQRLQAIGDWRLLLDERPQVIAPSRSRLGWAVAGAALLIALAVSWVAWRATRPVERPLMRLDVDLGPDSVAGQLMTAAISPDGARLVFPAKSPDAKQMLATRLLAETKPVLLSGTEAARDPFFSPDGQWIGFFADGKMKKIPVQGGAPTVLCDAPNARGANWGEDGFIAAALSYLGPLSRVSADGGAPQPVTKQAAITHRWPQPLPGGQAVLFTLSSSGVAFEDASIAAVSLKTGEIKTLVRGGYFGRYLPTGGATGHLVYVHDGVLFGVAFDPARLELRGTAVPLLQDLAGDPNSGLGQFSFSRTGTFVYRTGKVSRSWPVSWLDSSGKTEPLITSEGFYVTPRFSPDGQRLALFEISGRDRRFFVYDRRRDVMSRVPINAQQPGYPAWSPDGKHIVFWFGGFSIGWIRADGAGEIQHLLDSKNLMLPYSFFPDGRRLAYFELDPNTGWDLWTLPLDVSDPDHPKPGKPEPFLRAPSNERDPAVSPDGRWIAYSTDESGRDEVYVRPFPGPGGKWQISNAGGQQPLWSRNGREIFFQNPDNRIMVTHYELKDDSFLAGKPRLWSDQQLHELSGVPNYDLAPDGKRFAIVPEPAVLGAGKGNVHVTFLLNFFDELRRRAPAGK